MHNLFLDTNIIVDYLGNRFPFDVPAKLLFEGFSKNKYDGSTSIINLIHAHYQLRKKLNESQSRIVLRKLSDLLKISDIPGNLSISAFNNSFISDFEDAVQYELALLSKADFFITRNIKDFPTSAPFIICDAETYLTKHSLKE